MPNYRSKYKNYYSDKTGGYTSVGSILPVIVDQHTDSLNNVTGAPPVQNIEYNYPGWIYTDGSEYNIKEYPFLYDVIGNRYNSSTSSDNTVFVSDVQSVGAIQKMFWNDNKLYVEILDDSGAPALQDDKRAWPYDCSVRITDLGSIPTGLFEVFGSALSGGGFSSAAYNLVVNDNLVGILSSSAVRTVYKVLDKDGNDFDGTQYTQANYTIDFTTGGNTHPTLRVTKAFKLSDYPHFIGKFRVPDYRERKLLGYGDGVNGGGTSVVENRTSIKVGDIGGKWVIPKTRLDDPGSFYTISDVTTSGYDQVKANVPMQLIGSVKYEVGPMADQPLARPPEHDHNLMHSRVDPTALPALPGFQDEFTSGWRTQAAQVLSFVPGTTDGSQLWHSHGIIGQRLQNASTATYGNVGGIGEVVDDTAACPDYRITQAPPLPIASVTSDGTDLTVSCTASHNLSVGNWITITSAGGNWDGNYEIKTVTSGVAFVAQKPTGESMPQGTMPSGAVVKQADGVFEPVPTLDDPLAYVVNAQTVIGNQPIIIYDPSQMETRYEEELTSAGTIVKNLADAGTDVATVEISIISPGGAGGSSTQNGGTPGSSYVQFTFDGNTYTAYCYGGQGGNAGNNNAGAGGSGGTYAIQDSLGNDALPILLNDSRFSINVQANGQPGGAGGAEVEVGGAGGIHPNANNIGSGGGGTGQSYSTTTTEYFPGPGANDFLYNTNGRGGSAVNGTYTPPAGSVTNTVIKLSGGAGGWGNGPNGGNAMSGCSAPYIGGAGRNGSVLTLTANGPVGFTYSLASAGGHGTATQSGNSGEQPNNNFGRGENSAADGGGTGPGAWGNAGTGGAGGGCSTIRVSGQLAAGAGGGGGGGGSGGGWNGGMTDVCDAGEAGQPTNAGLHASGSIQCNAGGPGGSAGCTAGSGGGGGAGAGDAASAGGGSGGQDSAQGGTPGEGHGNRGGGKGGYGGQSAYRSNVFATGAVDINGGSDGQGYLQVTATATTAGTSPAGGGGGSGAMLSISLTGGAGDDLATGITAVLSAPGSGGGTGGGDGKIYVKLAGLKAGESGETGRTTAQGRGYRCPDYPTSKDYDEAIIASGTNIWADATTDGGNANDIKIISPTTGTFPVAPSAMHDGKVTRFINFSGAGERKLTIGPLNGTYINTLYFDIIKGNGSNGGQTPQENLKLYYKTSIDGSPTLADAIVLTSVNDPSYETYSYVFPVSSQAAIRNATLYLDLVQDYSGSNPTDNSFGISQMVATYNERINYVFTPSSNASIPGNAGTCGTDIGINSVRREVEANASGMFVNGGDFVLNASNPVTVSSSVIVANELPLITKYFRSKYLIKAI